MFLEYLEQLCLLPFGADSFLLEKTPLQKGTDVHKSKSKVTKVVTNSGSSSAAIHIDTHTQTTTYTEYHIHKISLTESYSKAIYEYINKTTAKVQ